MEDSDSESHKKLIILIISLIGLIVLVSTAYAIDTGKQTTPVQVDKKTTESLKIVNYKKTRNNPTMVRMNTTTIEITQMKCSCGWNKNHYKKHNKTIFYKNYCPFCHKWNTLKYNPKRVSEGELSCKHCSADFCLVDGNDKSYKVRKKLKR